MIHVEAVKAFNDNYLWVFHSEGSNVACVVDPGAADPVLAYLAQAGLQLGAILVTHHHADHIGGIDRLLEHGLVPVYGPATPRIPQVTHPVQEGDRIEVLGQRFSVLEIPGHTLEHIAYTTEALTGKAVAGADKATLAAPLLFCGDTLFAAGCGRMFEGTPPMMHASLQKLAGLDPATQVFCAHEYTLSNLRFAKAVMPDNTELQLRTAREQAKRDHDLPTLPSTIAVELQTNPFMRCADAAVVAAAGQQQPDADLDPASVFGILRRWKDSF